MAANQLNSIKRLKRHFDIETKKTTPNGNLCIVSIQLLYIGMAFLWEWQHTQNGEDS